MTTKDFPLARRAAVRRAWWGQAYYEEWLSVGEDHAATTLTPDNRLADRDGGHGIDPDPDTKRWEWDIDLTAEEESAWAAMVERIRAGTALPSAATINGLISTMRAYRNSTPGTPTRTQMDTTIRAIIDYIRYIEARLD